VTITTGAANQLALVVSITDAHYDVSSGDSPVAPVDNLEDVHDEKWHEMDAWRWDEKKQHANTWPWGDVWDAEKCNNCDDHNPVAGGYRVNQSAPVGSYPAGASPYGCMDMVGNAYEWVADDAKSYPGNPNPFEHKGFHFVRGGCWDDGHGSSVRCSYRNWYLPAGSGGVGPGDSDYIGFRVAR